MKVPSDIRQYVEAILLKQNNNFMELIQYKVNKEIDKRIAVFEDTRSYPVPQCQAALNPPREPRPLTPRGAAPPGQAAALLF